MITSGSVVLDGNFSLALDDGFSFSGGESLDFQRLRVQCFGVQPGPCELHPYQNAFLNPGNGFTNGMTSGRVSFTLGSVFPVNQLPTETFQVPFTASGSVYGPFTSTSVIQPCELPGNTVAGGCAEPISGSGVALITVQHSTLIDGDYYYYISGTEYDFSAGSAFITPTSAPEPSTFLLLLLPAALLARRASPRQSGCR